MKIIYLLVNLFIGKYYLSIFNDDTIICKRDQAKNTTTTFTNNFNNNKTFSISEIT